jgi:hypothetical protein
VTIKSLDLQVLLPKVQEVAKQMNNLKQHDPAHQQLLAQQTQKELAQKRSKVASTKNTENKRVTEKEKEGKGQQKEAKGAKEDIKQETRGKKRNIGKEISHLGHKLDLKI